jgi:RNA polymerase primary sigma factor
VRKSSDYEIPVEPHPDTTGSTIFIGRRGRSAHGPLEAEGKIAMTARKMLHDTYATSAEPILNDGMQPSSRPGELDDGAEGQVYRQWRLGVPVAVLSQQKGLSASVIERMINKTRAHAILGRPLEYMYHPIFEEPDAAATILAPMPGPARTASRPKPPDGLPPYLASLYNEAELLSRDQEAHLFRKMNYLKFRASNLREALDPARARASELDEIARLQEEALAVKNQLIRANLRLVVSIAKKRVGPSNDFFELVSDGNMSLIHAVEKFDFARGFKFSTYASWAIIKNYARANAEDRRRRDRFVTGHDELFEAAADHRSDEYEYESDRRRTQAAVQRVLSRLNDREREILSSRFGLGGANELTLERIGRKLGVSKERVRQIESRAQNKLRAFALTTKDTFE